MSDRNPSPAGGPLVEGPHDPEHDPTASYALEPEYAAAPDRAACSPRPGETVEVRSPLNGAAAGAHPAVERRRRGRGVRAGPAGRRQAWARTPLDERAAALLRLHDLILDRQDEIIDLIVLGVRQGPQARVRRAAARRADRPLLRAHRPPSTSTPSAGSASCPALTRVEVNRVPKGVVGIISPWNYPFTMALCDGLPALLAGNAVVAKPDAQTMLSALLGAQLLEEAGFPRGPVAGRRRAGRARSAPRSIGRADYVCFTGSTATGKLIAQGCAERLIGCSLELGGKNPILVLRDADLEKAAEGAVRASFSNAGQLCVSMERMFVADQVYDRFVERFVARTEAMTLGASLDWGNDMGSLISQDQLDTVTAPRRGRRRQGRPGAHRRPGAARPRPVLLRADHPRGRHARHDLLRRGDLRPGDLGLPLPRRGRRDRAGQRGRVRPERLDLQPGRRPRPGRSPRQIKCGTVNINEAFGATFAQHRRADGRHARVRAWAAARAARASSATPSRSRSRTQRLIRFAPMLGMSDETYAKVMTANLRLMKKLGRAVTERSTSTSSSSAPASAGRSPRCG